MSVSLPIKGLTKFVTLHTGCVDEQKYSHSFKFIKFSMSSQFVKNHILKYPDYLNKTFTKAKDERNKFMQK